MNFTSLLFLLISTLASFAFSAPVHVVQRDVYVPPVTEPTTATTWTVGETVTITWDVSAPPSQITNPYGSIRLRKADRTLPLVLADGFDILLGTYDVTVPWVVEGSDYQIVLFGDSGNFSPSFTITGGPPY